MEREEIERAADSLFALSLIGDEAERRAVAAALARRLADIPDLESRVRRSHALVQLMRAAMPWASRVRHLAVMALGWSHGDLGRFLGVSRASAQTIVRRPGRRLPWEDGED